MEALVGGGAAAFLAPVDPPLGVRVVVGGAATSALGLRGACPGVSPRPQAESENVGLALRGPGGLGPRRRQRLSWTRYIIKPKLRPRWANAGSAELILGPKVIKNQSRQISPV